MHVWIGAGLSCAGSLAQAASPKLIDELQHVSEKPQELDSCAVAHACFLFITPVLWVEAYLPRDIVMSISLG